jgi:hypothetical protein
MDPTTIMIKPRNVSVRGPIVLAPRQLSYPHRRTCLVDKMTMDPAFPFTNGTPFSNEDIAPPMLENVCQEVALVSTFPSHSLLAWEVVSSLLRLLVVARLCKLRYSVIQTTCDQQTNINMYLLQHNFKHSCVIVSLIHYHTRTNRTVSMLFCGFVYSSCRFSFVR